MNRGIQQKLLWSFLAVAIVSLLTINLLINIVISYSFSNYLENQRAEETEILKKDLLSTYITGVNWSSDTLMGISHYTLMKNLLFRLYDANGQLIWDSSAMVDPSMVPDENILTERKGDIESTVFTLVKDQAQIGQLEILPSYVAFKEHEERFLRLSNFLNWIAMGIVLVGVYYFSRFISKGISSPLIHIKNVALRMKEGNLSSRTDLISTSSEIKEVGDALNNLAQSLQEQEKLRKNLTADIAHELRTPLAIVRGQIEAFQDGVWEPDSQKLKICHDQIMQLVQLVDDLENLADIENPMLKLQKERINIHSLIVDAVHSVQSLCEEKEIEFSMHAQQPIYVIGDYRRLLQVFINLLTNAYKYSDVHGAVCIRLNEEERMIRIEVQDTGSGITPDDIPNIFNRFYRADKSRNRKKGGAGIGLAIVKGIIEAHNGRVMVESKINQGTTFIVLLPK